MLQTVFQVIFCSTIALGATTVNGTANECVFGPQTIPLSFVVVQIFDSSRAVELVAALRLLGHRDPMSVGDANTIDKALANLERAKRAAAATQRLAIVKADRAGRFHTRVNGSRLLLFANDERMGARPFHYAFAEIDTHGQETINVVLDFGGFCEAQEIEKARSRGAFRK